MSLNSTLAVVQPAVEKYITSSDGVQIYATAVGQSHLPSLVFVHGFACSALIWAHILQNKELLKHFYLVAYDLRGHGRSGKPDTAAGYLSRFFAEDFANVVREFSLNAPVYVGWSYGGTVVADIFANLGPKAISGVVYTAASPWNDASVFGAIGDPSFFSEIVPSFLTFDNVTYALEGRARFVDAMVNEPEKVPTAEKWGWLGAATLVGPRTAQFLLDRKQDPEPLIKAAESGFPALLITGGNDKAIQAAPLTDFIEGLFTNVTTYDFPQGSHAMFYESEHEYVQQVITFATSVFRR